MHGDCRPEGLAAGPPEASVSLSRVLDLVGLTGQRFALAAIKDRKIEPACFTDVRRAEGWLVFHEDKNCYITLNPVEEGVNGRPKAKDIHRTPWLLVDLDPDNPTDDLLPVAQRLHERIGGILVFSGRGYQIWLEVGEDADRAGILRRLRSEITECKVDATHDPSRLCRLPGTVNLKTGKRAEILAVTESRPPEPLAKPKRVVKETHASDAEIESLLSVLDPDMDYNDWLRVGMALHHAGQEIGAWESWSSKGSKYEEGCCERWYGFSSDGENPVTTGTLRHLALEAGWEPGSYLQENPDDGELWGWVEAMGMLSEVCKEAKVTKADARKAAKRVRINKKLANLPQDEARYTCDDDTWWFNHDPHGWQKIGPKNLADMLGEGASEIRAALLKESWIQVAEPFGPEELSGRRWNRTGAKLIEPEEGEFPTIRKVLAHLSQGIDHLYEGYLEQWAARIVQNPKGKLPVLFFYSRDNNTGKSSFCQVMKSMFVKGAVDGAGVVRGGSGSRFTDELEGAVFVWFDEEKSQKGGMDKLKKFVTEPDFLCEGKGKARRVAPNYTHWVVTSNHPDAIPFDDADQRVVMIHVDTLEEEIEKDEFLARVEEEAPFFLHYLLNLTLPKKVGRLQIPVLQTAVKVEQATSGMDPVLAYTKKNRKWLVTPLKVIADSLGMDPLSVERGLPVDQRAQWRVLSRMAEKKVEGSATEIKEALALDYSIQQIGRFLAQGARDDLVIKEAGKWRVL